MNKPYHNFICSCDESKEFTLQELQQHIINKHGFDLKGKKMNREMLLHVNKKPRHLSIYKLTGHGLTIYEYIG